MSSNFRRIQEIVLGARRRTGAERELWLRQQCGQDAALRQEVDSLLDQDRSSASILATGGALASAAAANLEQRSVGPYTLVELLGEGGMGVVYRAEQHEPIRRDVAVKLIRWGFGSERARSRFDAEREALSRMDHPGIARVLDAGTSTEGSPYVVMELVRGVPITQYCDEHLLSVQQRVALVREVCLAVHHAHQKGVVHRDLKPSNVMVEEHDGRPVVRIIDFGIAKAIEGTLGSEPTLTVPGQLIGTPEYMSPEQVGSHGRIVDTRSDVYALGVLLFELLVGDTPVGRSTLEGKAITEILEIVRSFEPPVPSRRLLGAPTAERERIAALRASSPSQLSRLVRGDLDWVVGRAIERDPEHRYGSATALAEDLQRYLGHQVVLAGPPSGVHKARKFIRRNRTVILGLSAVFLVLAAGVVATTWQFFQARQHAQRAEKRLEDIRRFTLDFVFELDTKLNRLDGAGETREFLAAETLRQLDAIVADDESGDKLQPVLAGAYRRISKMQKEFGQSAEAVVSAETAIGLHQRYGERFPDDMETWRSLGVLHDEIRILYNQVGQFDRSVATLEKAVEYFEKADALVPGDRKTERYLSYGRVNLAGELFQVGRTEEAAELFRLGIDWRRAAVRERPEVIPLKGDLSRGLRRYAGFLYDTGDTLASLEANREMIALAKEVYDDKPDRVNKGAYASALGQVGWYHHLTGNPEEAERVLLEVSALYEELLKDNPGMLRYSSSLTNNFRNLAAVCSDWGRNSQQLEYARRALQIAEDGERASPGNIVFVTSQAKAKKQIGDAHLELGEWDAASTAMREGLLAWEKVLQSETHASADFYEAAELKYNLGVVLERQAEESEDVAIWSSAKGWYQMAMEDLRTLDAQGALMDYQRPLFDLGEASIALCDSVLALTEQR